MMIVRVSSLKPRIVVFHKTMPDAEAIRIAEYEQIPIIYSSAPTLEQLVMSLRKLYRIALRVKLGKKHVRPPPKISA
jgi:predicted transcriptional regulator